jgi:hypothetical protein
VSGELREELPQPVALGVFDLATEKKVAESLCASSTTTRSQRQSGACSLSCTSSLRAILSSRAMTRLASRHQLPVRRFELVVGQDFEGQIEAAIELVLPLLGETSRADDETALQVAAGDQLLDQSPAMMVLPAPGSSASRKRSGWRGSMLHRRR